MYGATPGDAVKLKEYVGNKTVVMFGVPGAFTPGCSKVRPFHFPRCQPCHSTLQDCTHTHTPCSSDSRCEVPSP